MNDFVDYCFGIGVICLGVSFFKANDNDIPLYTHPADESFDRTASHMAGEYVSYPAKTLTDEEIIKELESEIERLQDQLNEFLVAKDLAILRKAQEK